MDDLQNIMLSEVTQTQKDKYNIYSQVAFRHKAKKNQPAIHIHGEPRQQRGP